MSNSKNSEKSKEDQKNEEPQPRERSRMDRSHGGKLLDAISPEELVSFNDASCKHETMTRDPSETEFNAFICDNPNCNVVALSTKVWYKLEKLIKKMEKTKCNQ